MADRVIKPTRSIKHGQRNFCVGLLIRAEDCLARRARRSTDPAVMPTACAGAVGMTIGSDGSDQRQTRPVPDQQDAPTLRFLRKPPVVYFPWAFQPPRGRTTKSGAPVTAPK
ncbi:hypothetical protein PCANC_23154 [Puccinia coronata f. sp. avenae]|uniref:Uncharacterized protein n=1 Tax=Puccinia coronata f. sp. avenae TaxID=200324 RepID=A0A2N5SB25_9BASI|nr:hypothetical protein PCANC_23154 [Puccinia coronata f. sp. avenae]